MGHRILIPLRNLILIFALVTPVWVGAFPFYTTFVSVSAAVASFFWQSIGAYSQPTNGYVTGGTFTNVGGDGAFELPEGVAVDTANNALYVADWGKNSVIKINRSTGAFIGAIGNMYAASTGTCPSSGPAPGWCTGGATMSNNGDGGFDAPADIVVDVANDVLYVSSSGPASRVSKHVASTGAFIGSIGTLASSDGTCPASGAASSWCTAGNGQFTNGGGDGMFWSVQGLALDVTNDVLYIADEDNYRIVKVVASTGAFIGAIGNLSASTGTCPASGAAPSWCTGGTFTNGAGDGMFAGPTDVAVDVANNALYIADYFGRRIVKVNASTGAFIGAIGRTTSSTGTCPASGAASSWCTGGTFATGTYDGAFYYPNKVDLDTANDALFISDRYNGRITKVVASTGAFVGVIGKTTSSSGTCPASGAAPSWCTGGTFGNGPEDGMFQNPRGVAVDAANNALYVADTGNVRLVKVALDTGAFVGANGEQLFLAFTWSPGIEGVQFLGDGMFKLPTSVAFNASDNALYVGDGSGRVAKINATTGVFIGGIGRLSSSTGTCPSSGSAPGWCTGGTWSQNGTDGGFGSPEGLAVDPDNNILYVTDNSSERVVKVDAATGAFLGAIGKTFSSSGTCPASGAASGWCTGGSFNAGGGDGMFFNPYGLAVDTTNNALYIADTGNNRVVKVNLSTGAFIGAIGNLTASTGTCPASGAAPSWCTGGTFGSGAGDGMLSSPRDVAIDVANNALYITDSNHRIVKATLSTGAFVGAIGLTTASSGTCPASGVASSWCTGGTFVSGSGDGMFNFPYGVELGPGEDALYITIPSRYRVIKVTASTGAFQGALGRTTSSTGTCPAAGVASTWCTGGTFAAGTGDGMFTYPQGVAVKNSNTFFIADRSNHRIHMAGSAPGAPSQFAWSGPESIASGGCGSALLFRYDSAGNPSAPATTSVATLGGNGTGAFYGDSGCSGTPITSLTIAAGQSYGRLYFKSPDGADLTWTASAAGMTQGNWNVKITQTCRIYPTGTTWTVTGDFRYFSGNTIEVLGAGGGGATGAANAGAAAGGGGGYSRASNVTIPDGTTTVGIGIGVGGDGTGTAGGDTYFCNSTTNCSSVAGVFGSAVLAGAHGGSGGASAVPSAGGATAGAVGSFLRAGGAGDGAGTGGKGGGGGGAAGPNSNGVAGAGQAGGAGNGGIGGAGGAAGAAGGDGTEWASTPVVYGTGGGGGGGVSGGPGGAAGSYGGGGGGAGKANPGGAGASGLIVITYTGTTCN